MAQRENMDLHTAITMVQEKIKALEAKEVMVEERLISAGRGELWVQYRVGGQDNRGGYRRNWGWNKPVVVARDTYVPKVSGDQTGKTVGAGITAKVDASHVAKGRGLGLNTNTAWH